MLTTVFLSLLPYQLPVENWQLSTQLSSLSYAENNSVYDLMKGNMSEYSESESAFTFNEVALSAQYQEFSVSLFKRYEWFLDFSQDTMPFYGSTVNGTHIEPNKTYDLDLNASHFDSEGIRFSYLYSAQKFRLYAAASYYQPNSFLDGNISGYVSRKEDCKSATNCYSGQLDLSYFYTEDLLLGRTTPKPVSLYGFGIDIGGDWSVNDNWLLSLLIRDVYSEIVWENAPYTIATAKTATSTVVDGHVKLDPTISGIEKNRTYTQHLASKTALRAEYTYNPSHSLSATAFYAYGASLINLGYQYHNTNAVYGFTLSPLEEAIGVNYKNRYINISATANPFDFKKSELYGFNIGFIVPF